MRSIFRLGITLVALVLAGCGQTTVGGPNGAIQLTGTLLDAPVMGVSYEGSDIAGVTDDQGQFDYVPGDLMTFSLAGHSFTPIRAKHYITILDLYETGFVDHRVLNLGRFLQSIDTDPEPGMIVLPDLSAYDLSTLSFDQDLDSFAQDAQVLAVLAEFGNQPNAQDLVASSVAVQHITDALAEFSLTYLGLGQTVDNDQDGLYNDEDPDDDNDGIDDAFDAFPFDDTETADADMDGLGNNIDPDDDNDGVLDTVDSHPFDASEQTDFDGDGIGDNADLDDDGDGVPDVDDQFPFDPTESGDFDGDGIGNSVDPDDDNDGLNDADEALAGSDPFNPDTDGDGLLDGEEFAPLVAATSYYVSVGGNDLNDCSSVALACATIERGVMMASFGDVVEVAAGTYTEPAIQITTDSVIVRGVSAASTIVQSAATLLAATLPIVEAGAGIDVLLQNITFRNGQAGADQGVINATSGTLWIVDSIVTGSDAGVGGAAVRAGGGLKLNNVSVTNNTTDGILVSGSGDIVIVGATVTGNAGTGLTVTSGALLASYSTFSNNGVGVLLQGAPSNFDHVTFDANTGSALVIDADVSVTVTHSTLSNHSATVVDAPGATIFVANHSTFSNSGPAIVEGATGTLFLNFVTIVNSGQLAAIQSNTININNSIMMGPS
ncbi:MAG: right-handed parallel beta-helix repeat-containing protein, partial [Gammaproteobacteria bacterium]|nr:right-handed parallel beta-helix repeat-containing protein [Gammaproteobacteria bacterium]